MGDGGYNVGEGGYVVEEGASAGGYADEGGEAAEG